MCANWHKNDWESKTHVYLLSFSLLCALMCCWRLELWVNCRWQISHLETTQRVKIWIQNLLFLQHMRVPISAVVPFAQFVRHLYFLWIPDWLQEVMVVVFKMRHLLVGLDAEMDSCELWQVTGIREGLVALKNKHNFLRPSSFNTASF